MRKVTIMSAVYCRLIMPDIAQYFRMSSNVSQGLQPSVILHGLS